MCFAPNLIRPKSATRKFLGGMKNYMVKNGISNQAMKKMLEAGEVIIVPCGQCMECRINYARNWAARCEVESYYYENNYFITLTYDDENVPVKNKVTGEEYTGIKDKDGFYKYGKQYEALTLKKKDLQDFFKRLREHAARKGWIEDENTGLRFYACGEYGTQKGRPHYHAIIYGLKLPDLVFHYQKYGHMHFKSQELRDIWGKGHIDVGGVDYESCQYVARYVMKKQKGKASEEWYRKRGIQQEFVQMSLKPGIGIRYYEEHRNEIYDKDLLYLKKGRTQIPPKAFDLKEEVHCLAEEYDISLEEASKMAKEKAVYYTDAESTTCMKVHSMQMMATKALRRKKSLDALFAQLEKTTQTLLGYLGIKQQSYTERRKMALQRAGGDAG